MRTIAAVAAIVLLAGCTSTIDAEPVKAPQTAVHCDLIFPPASVLP